MGAGSKKLLNHRGAYPQSSTSHREDRRSRCDSAAGPAVHIGEFVKISTHFVKISIDPAGQKRQLIRVFLHIPPPEVWGESTEPDDKTGSKRKISVRFEKSADFHKSIEILTLSKF